MIEPAASLTGRTEEPNVFAKKHLSDRFAISDRIMYTRQMRSMSSSIARALQRTIRTHWMLIADLDPGREGNFQYLLIVDPIGEAVAAVRDDQVDGRIRWWGGGQNIRE